MSGRIELVSKAIEIITGEKCITGIFPRYMTTIWTNGAYMTLDSIMYSMQLKLYIEDEKSFAGQTREISGRYESEYPDYIADYAIELAMLTGMRVGELAALHWNDIDDKWIHVDFSEHRLDYKDKKSEIVVGEPKCYKHRKIPLTDDIQSLFDKVKELGFNSLEGYVFCRKDGERCTAHAISSAVSRRSYEAGIKKTSIHRIRRTVSSFLRQELPIKAVANMLGHLATTNEQSYNYDTSEDTEKSKALTDYSAKLIMFKQMKGESQRQKKSGSA